MMDLLSLHSPDRSVVEVDTGVEVLEGLDPLPSPPLGNDSPDTGPTPPSFLLERVPS